MLPYVGLARWLTTFGRNADVLATVCGSSRVRFNYGPRTVANHEQGREIVFAKINFNCPEHPPGAGFSQAKFSEKFFNFLQPRLLSPSVRLSI
jgi:hypothetical protein